MPVPVARYRAARYLRWAGFVALGIAGFSAWVGLRWPFAWIAAGLGFASSMVVFVLAFLPSIEIYESHLKLGKRAIPWAQIRRVDRRSTLPLIVRLTLSDKRGLFVLHAGEPDSGQALLRHLRRYSREALIDGIPYRQFWGDSTGGRKQIAPPPRAPLLLPDDEAEVERLFQRLKSVGRIDQKSSGDEK